MLKLLEDFKILLTGIRLRNIVVARSGEENRIGKSIPHFGPQAATTCSSSEECRVHCITVVL